MVKGAAIITVERPPESVFNAISDVARMGDWSPECTGGRWIAPATGPAIGAKFEGDNIAKIGPVTVKKWTTTSEVTAAIPGELFEFIAEGYTRWRYELIDMGGVTRVTESFQHPPYEGFQDLLYNKIFKRQPAMIHGMQQTLERMKAILEAEA